MNNRLTLLCLLLTWTVGLNAQRFVVTGTAIDSKSKAPVEYAAAVLLKPDSTVAAGSMTDEHGAFSINARQAGKFILKLSYVGYKTTYRNIELTDERDSVNVGQTLLSADGTLLGTAEVSVTAARVEQKEDTTMFNASAYRVPEGSTLEALVKQLPGVEVSDDGTIKWNGKEVKEFLVNGKDFFKGDTKIAMKNLPTDIVSKIKAYEKKSDYTEQTGIDDGEETTVLDIATKRQLDESWVSNVDIGYGTHDRYSGRLFVTRFTDNMRITAYGSANNTGDMGFGGPRGFNRNGGGLTANKNAGIDFTWENGKKKREAGRFEIGGNVRYNHTGTDAITTSASETFLSAGSSRSFSNSHNFSRSSSTSVNGALRVQWNPDSMTTVTFRPSFSHTDGDNSGNSRTATFNDDPYSIEGMYSPLDSIFKTPVNEALKAIAVNSNLRSSLGDSKSNSVNGTLNIVRRLNSKGRNVSLRATGGYSKSESRSFSISDIEYFNGTTAPAFKNQYSHTPERNHSYGIRVGYAEPIAKNWFAEFRYDYNYKYTKGDRSRYNLDSLAYGDYASRWPQYASYGDRLGYPVIGSLPTEDEVLNAVRDLNNSQYATYKYYNHTAEVGVRYNSEAIRFNAGVDFNPEKTRMAYKRPGQNIDTLITRHVFKVSPQVRFRYRFSKTEFLDFRYNGYSSQPSMTNLLAVIDDSNPLSVSMGNPGLKPSWNNSFRLFYHGYNADRQQGMGGGVNFTQTSNSISNRNVYDETTGALYSRPENINGNWNARGHFMFNTGLGAKKLFTVTTFTSLNYDNSVGYISRMNNTSGGTAAGGAGARTEMPLADAADGTTAQKHDYDYYNRIFANAAASKNTTRAFSVGENLNLAYRASWFDVGLLGTLNYQHARATLQENANMDTWDFAYGANANFMFDFGLAISTDIRMNSRRGYSDRSMNTNELLWNAQISQSFLKNKAATISIQFYDILHEQSNVSRVINATRRSDTWSNAINSYCMVHFIYKLNIFGGKSNSKDSKDREQFRGPGGEGRPRPAGAPMRAMPMMPMGGARHP